MTERGSVPLLAWLGVLAAAVLWLDLLAPAGLAIGMGYMACVLLAAWRGRQEHVLGVTAVCTLLLVAVATFVPERAGSALDLFNRGLTLLGLWAVAALAIAGRRVRRRHRDSRSLVAGILHTVIDAIIAIDRRGMIRQVNPATEQLFGFGREELIGHNVSMLMPPADAERHDGYIQRYLKTGKAHIIGRRRQMLARRADGSEFPMELAVTELGQGDDRLFVGIIRDLSAEREAAEALERERARYQELQLQLLEQENLAALGGMAAAVSHEVSTPLGLALTAASHGSDKLARGGLSPEAVGELLAIVEKNLHHASRIMRGFKEVAVDRVSEERRRIRLSDYLDEVALTLHPRLKRSTHALEIDCPGDLELETDPGAISQIVTNLVMNSLTHAFEGVDGGTMRLKARRVDGGTELQYRDDGAGIPRSRQEQIFQPGFTTRRGRGGSGLGLAIVYNLVTRLLEGRIELESEPGKGVCFVIFLPDLKSRSEELEPGSTREA